MSADLIKEDRKKIAAITAVLQYLQVESKDREILFAGSEGASITVAVPDKTKRPAIASWGTSGRQAQMQMRVMVQMKAFH